MTRSSVEAARKRRPVPSFESPPAFDPLAMLHARVDGALPGAGKDEGEDAGGIEGELGRQHVPPRLPGWSPSRRDGARATSGQFVSPPSALPGAEAMHTPPSATLHSKGQQQAGRFERGDEEEE